MLKYDAAWWLLAMTFERVGYSDALTRLDSLRQRITDQEKRQISPRPLYAVRTCMQGGREKRLSLSLFLFGHSCSEANP